jgi:hydrogenase-1 operon protein HyaE
MNLEAERERALLALVERLATQSGIPTVAAADVESAVAGDAPFAVLLTASKSPESWDVCIVLPELLRAVPGMRAIALTPAESAKLASKYGIDKYPSVVVLRGGRYAGVIEGMQDWDPFCAALAGLAVAEPKKPPSLRIPIVREELVRDSALRTDSTPNAVRPA